MVRRIRSGLVVLAVILGLPCCDTGMDPDDPERNDLATMETARLTIDGQEFEVWVARDDDEQRLGLMWVSAAELAPTSDGAIRGMLFVYPSERVLSFWMRNTIVDLDIAFMRADNTVVTIHTMDALSLDTWSSGVPAMYALEVLAGTLDNVGVNEGDVADLPAGL